MYYGNKKVFTMSDMDDGRKLITFEDNSSIALTDVIAASAITTEPKDDTTLRDLRCWPVVKQVLEVLLKADIHIGEVDFVMSRATMSIENSVEQASLILWNVDRSGSQNMSDVDKILKGKVDPNKVTMEENTENQEALVESPETAPTEAAPEVETTDSVAPAAEEVAPASEPEAPAAEA